MLRRCQGLPGWVGWSVAVQDLGPVGAVGGGGAVGMENDGPAPLVDHDVVVIPAEKPAVVEAGLAAVGLGSGVVDLACRGGLVAAVGEPAVLVPRGHRGADRGGDVPADPDVQRQAGGAEASPELLGGAGRGPRPGGGPQL